MFPLLLLTLTLASYTHAQLILGPYDMEWEQVIPCPDHGTNEIQFNFHLRKLGRGKTSMHGNFTVLTKFDDTQVVHTEFFNWGNGGWKKGLVISRKKACTTTWTMLGGTGAALRENMKLPRPSCPVKKGVYKIEDFDTTALRKLGLPGMIQGKFKVNLMVKDSKGEKVLGCSGDVFRAWPLKS